MQMKTSSPSDFRKSSIGFWRSRESAERSRSRTQLVGQCCACKFCNSPSPQQVFSIKATASVWNRARNIPSWQWSRIWIYLWFFVSLKWTFSAEIIFERNHYNMFSDGGLAQSVSRCLESFFSCLLAKLCHSHMESWLLRLMRAFLSERKVSDFKWFSNWQLMEFYESHSTKLLHRNLFNWCCCWIEATMINNNDINNYLPNITSVNGVAQLNFFS